MDRAPSIGNTRPWRVVQVENTTARSRIIGSFKACNLDAACAYDGDTRQDYLALKLAGFCEAPVHLAIFTDWTIAEGRGLGRHRWLHPCAGPNYARDDVWNRCWCRSIEPSLEMPVNDRSR